MENEEKKSGRGGRRDGAGRKGEGRNVQLLVRISPEAKELISTVSNQSEWIDTMIKKHLKKK